MIVVVATLTAHPRSRGENALAALGITICGGSSPLTRGKLRGRAEEPHLRGLIPAHAGKTPRRPGDCCRGEAHPRSRGENEMTNIYLGTAGGSSPLTRGKHPARVARGLVPRLIPAHAGKTARRTLQPLAITAHPRSRGENNGQPGQKLVLRGSSPLTRGKHVRSSFRSTGGRLIPAHAGKTHSRPPKRSPQGAHPRSRGENQGFVRLGDLVAGSSPLTRGKLCHAVFPSCRNGLIPAHAGKTETAAVMALICSAHPRSRGENGSCPGSGRPSQGSSPLTRGKPTGPHAGGHYHRLIPAHAGKTLLRAAR